MIWHNARYLKLVNFELIFLIFFHWWISIKGPTFCKIPFLTTSIFKSLYFLKLGPIFVGPTLCQNAAISLKPINCFDKIKQILYPQGRISMTQLTSTDINSHLLSWCRLQSHCFGMTCWFLVIPRPPNLSWGCCRSYHVNHELWDFTNRRIPMNT